ncbi:MAG: agmatine deiminase family protein [Prevotella sp.]|jgi:agmatine/peptidylarginine deiminase|nr:agmatine deiminase family protein [Prevotella sp.]MCI2087701.1 agmatine deiminase family protein [Prevotella sp.]MCI2125308.1 agmatine deiminase family protein [Prevotella sp.]
MNKIIHQNKHYYLPAEWASQSGIQLTWPHERTDWSPYLTEITETFIQLARLIAEEEKVLIVTPHKKAVRQLLTGKLGPELSGNLLFYSCDTNDTWARDHAFLTLTARDEVPQGRNDPTAIKDSPIQDRDHSQKEDKPGILLDFHFNGWGEKYPSDLDNRINRELYEQGALNGIKEDHENFVLEGGSIESDGRGTIFTTSHCLMAPHRNQPLTQEEITTKLRSYLHARRIIWLDHGLLEGDDTDGHIDTIVRTAPNNTLLYMGCQDKQDPQYEDFKALERQLQTLETLDGRPYRLRELPMPDALYDKGERLPATYANFVITNSSILYPTYNQPEKDSLAGEILSGAFPGRKITGIDAQTAIRQHGSLHCLTMQYPEGIIRSKVQKQE